MRQLTAVIIPGEASRQHNVDILDLTFLNPNINMHFLHTVLYTLPKVLTRRFCQTIKSFFSW